MRLYPHPPSHPVSAVSILPLPQARCLRSGQDIVLKVYSVSSLSDFLRNQVLRELDIHSRLDHPNVVQLLAAFRVRGRCDLVNTVSKLFRVAIPGSNRLPGPVPLLPLPPIRYISVVRLPVAAATVSPSFPGGAPALTRSRCTPVMYPNPNATQPTSLKP